MKMVRSAMSKGQGERHLRGLPAGRQAEGEEMRSFLDTATTIEDL